LVSNLVSGFVWPTCGLVYQLARRHELGMKIMCANTPAPKGRVERPHGTLQDRLVKQMRLEGVSTIADANSGGRESYRRNGRQAETC
jgi:hypothetical protein